MKLLTALTATPVFTLEASVFQPIVDTLSTLVTTCLPVVISVAAIWIGVGYVKRFLGMMKHA